MSKCKGKGKKKGKGKGATRMLGLLVAFLLMFGAAQAQAASLIKSELVYSSDNMRVLKLDCVSHTDGNFTALSPIELPDGFEYWVGGFVLTHAVAINGASGYPDTAGTVTIFDVTGQQIIGSTAGDTLTLSTSASGYALLSSARSPAQRPCFNKYYATIGDTQSGTATSTFAIYLFFMK